MICRQPVLEGLGWVTHWFYLPLALFIPTPQMLVHSEFNFIYQFLIHTELLGDMGPLGYILNTASHHRKEIIPVVFLYGGQLLLYT